MIPGYPGGMSLLDEGPYRAAPVSAGLICPRCPGVMLSRRTLMDYVGVDDCPRCGGSFLTARALDAVCTDLALYQIVRDTYPAAPIVTPVGPMYVRCPECDDVMNRRLFADGARVVLDVCRAHGTWLDRGELRAVVDFVEAGGYEEQQKRETARRFDEARAADAAVRGFSQPARSRGRVAQAILDLLTFWM